MSLSKRYQNVLTYESVKLMKRSVSMNTNESIEINTLNTNDEMRNHLLSYDVLILEVNFNDVWVEWNWTLYIAPLSMMPSIEKGGGSRKSHEMRLWGMLGMSLFISPSLQTYTANIGI